MYYKHIPLEIKLINQKKQKLKWLFPVKTEHVEIYITYFMAAILLDRVSSAGI